MPIGLKIFRKRLSVQKTRSRERVDLPYAVAFCSRHHRGQQCPKLVPQACRFPHLRGKIGMAGVSMRNDITQSVSEIRKELLSPLPGRCPGKEFDQLE